MTLFQSFITSIADAGRELIEGPKDKPNLKALCEDLLSQKGEALGTALARELLVAYEGLKPDERLAFFTMLVEDFAPDGASLELAIETYRKQGTPEAAQDLSEAAEAPRQTLIRRMNMAPGGTASLVALRAELLSMLKIHPELKPLDRDLEHLLASWFNRGFLRLEKIDWNTPAAVLEKLIAYEAVHAIQDWSDLRRRLEDDRRCYGFFHPALPGEPLIFVEVALVDGLAGSVQTLLDRDQHGDPLEADTAIFYSISNCQEGLRGISFGNFLIKQVVAELSAELPNLDTYSTLSPIPGFARWLDGALQEGRLSGWSKKAARDVLRVTGKEGADKDGADKLGEAGRERMTNICAHYLLKEKRGGKPIDPVARFHLGNGARVERINWAADKSANGLKQSFGLMVNYLYDLKRIEEYHEAYVNEGKVSCAKSVQSQAKEADILAKP